MRTARLMATGIARVLGVAAMALIAGGRHEPRAQPAPAQPQVVQIVTGFSRNYHAVRNDGSLWTWAVVADRTQPAPPPKLERVGTDADWSSIATTSSERGVVHMALKRDGSLWAWGKYLRDDNRVRPERVGTGQDWVAVSLRRERTQALKRDGTLWTWGFATPVLAPHDLFVRVGTDTDWKAVEGDYALKRDGSLWAWERTPDITGAPPHPRRFGTDSDWAAVSDGWGHRLALKTDGTLWVWGYSGGDGELGLGERGGPVDIPVRVGMDADWVEVSAGDRVSFARKRDGSLWAWGQNKDGRLALGDGMTRVVPTRVGTATDWAGLARGIHSLAAWRRDGTVWIAGSGWPPGAGGEEPMPLLSRDIMLARCIVADFPAGVLPVNVREIDRRACSNEDHWRDTEAGAPVRYRQVSTSFTHTLALADDGALWAWGVSDSDRSEFGIGERPDILGKQVRVGEAADWRQVSAGDAYAMESHQGFSLAIKNDGTLWAWGDNQFGQLGLPPVCGPAQPVAKKKPVEEEEEEDDSFRPLPCDAGAAGATAKADTAPVERASRPTQVGRAADWSRVSAGSAFALALKTDGTLWAWGYQGYGAPGVGKGGSRVALLQQVPGRDWRAVSAGESHTLALKTDGTLWAWGYNGYGQAGRGQKDRGGSVTPRQIGAARDWKDVAASQHASYALKADGTLWVWGQSKRGDTEFHPTPMQVGSTAQWSMVFPEYGHFLARKADGSLWADSQHPMLLAQSWVPVRVPLPW